MMDQTNVGVSPPEGHLQSIYHKLTTQMGCHRPADYSPRVDVEYEGQVEKTLPGIDVGYVRRPDLVRSRCGEVPRQEIRSGCGVRSRRVVRFLRPRIQPHRPALLINRATRL